jgi:predicted DNA-binding protein (UPF0251 family)
VVARTSNISIDPKAKDTSWIDPVLSERTPVQRDIDKMELMRLLVRGWTMEEAAIKLKITREQVQHDYSEVMKDLVRERTTNAEALRQMKLREYAQVKKEAWEAWERSKEDWHRRIVEETQSEGSNSGGYTNYKTIDTTEGHLPSNEYLKTVVSCLNAERALQGIDPPKKLNVSGTIVSWDVLVDQLPPESQRDEVEEAILGALNAGMEVEGIGPPQLPAPRVIIEGTAEPTKSQSDTPDTTPTNTQATAPKGKQAKRGGR